MCTPNMCVDAAVARFPLPVVEGVGLCHCPQRKSLNELVGGNMHGRMSIDNPTVKFGNILNVLAKDENDKLMYKQYIVAKEFDYRDLLEAIREEGIYKTEDVYVRLGVLLVERELVFECEAALLDLGVVGRVSEAVMSVYKDKLNDRGRLVDSIVKDVFNNCWQFEGPEGDLHLMHVEKGYTLGYAKLCISCSRNVERWITLDIVGPSGADFPPDLQEQIEARLTQYISEKHPDEYLALRAYIGRSELAQSQDTLVGVHS